MPVGVDCHITGTLYQTPLVIQLTALYLNRLATAEHAVLIVDFASCATVELQITATIQYALPVLQCCGIQAEIALRADLSLVIGQAVGKV